MSVNKSNDPIIDEKKLEEEYEDSFYRLIMYKYAQKAGEELLKENEKIKNDPQYAPSKEAKERLNKIINEFFRKRKFREVMNRAIKILKMVGMIFLVFTIIFTVTFLTVDAFRVQVLNILFTFEKEYTTIKIGDGEPNEDIIAGLSNTYSPTYIPAGYRRNMVSSLDDVKSIEYINDEEKIIKFREYNTTTADNIDTEKTDLMKYIDINGINGLFVVKDGISKISWIIDDKLFVIIAQISENEIVKIAKSVNFIK